MTPTKEKSFSIPEAATYTGFTEGYIRLLIRRKQLASRLEPIAEGSGISRRLIYEEDLQTFLEDTPRKNRRKDGRTKYVLYATDPEIEETLRVLNENRVTKPVAHLIATANKLKPGKQKGNHENG